MQKSGPGWRPLTALPSKLIEKHNKPLYRAYLATLYPLLGSVFVSFALWAVTEDIWPDIARLIVCLLIVAAGLFGTFIVAAARLRQLLRPLTVLARAMHRLTKGEEGVQVAKVSEGDMGRLETGFNAMAERLDQVNEQKQAEIEQATADLAETLEALEIRNVELDIARKRAIAANQVKSDFLTNISQEIRSPLSGIVGFSEILGHSELTAQQAEYLNSIRHSSTSLLAIVDDILDYASLESGELVLSEKGFSLRETIHRALQLVVQPVHAKHLELVSLVYNDVPDRMIGDASRILQILSNLLSNALKFTDQGEIVLRVMMEDCAAERITLGITVSDTGIGIPEDQQNNLFGAFQRGGLTHQPHFRGTGLGLNLCQRLAQAMGGRIEVSSRPGEGSTFRVNLTLLLDSQPPAGKGVDKINRQAMLFDPHAVSRIALRNALMECGMTLEVSEELPEFETLPKETLVFLANAASDHDLKQLSAHITRCARAQRQVVAIVGSSDPLKLQAMRDAGAVLVLTKPLIWDNVCDAISKLSPRVIETASDKTPDLEPADTESQTRVLDQEAPLAGLRVLAVDDNPINLQLVGIYLRNMGATVIEANDGQEAIDACKDQQPLHLAILDLHMPRVDGFAAARAIRQLEVGKQLPLVALTADMAEQSERDALGAGFDRRLTKPVTEDELRDQLLEVLLLSPNQPAARSSKPSRRRPSPVKQAAKNTGLPIRNEEQALRVAGNSKAVAEKLLNALLEELPQNLATLEAKYAEKDWVGMWDEAHRLHGASAVCAVEALHAALVQLQSAIKARNTTALHDLMAQTHSEVERLMAHAKP